MKDLFLEMTLLSPDDKMKTIEEELGGKGEEREIHDFKEKIKIANKL